MFDANRQLAGVTRADGSIWAYDYDALGNRVRVGGANGLTYYQYTYYQNASGKNTQRLRNAMGPEFAYDANGNVVTEGGTSYTWDVSNRLVGTAGAKYVYDYMDRLAQYIPPASSPAVRNITLGQDTIAERSTDPTRTNDYLFGPGIDEPLAKRASDGTISYYAIDGLGSVVATTDGSAQISRSAGFDEWGAPISGAADFFGYGGALVGRPPYIGWNRRHRYYRPGLGRFMNEDPLEQHLRIASLQTYVYAANNPISFGDPYGLFCFSYTSYGPKQTYAKSPPKWTGWQPAGEHESPHEPEPGVPYKASNGSMAQAGGYKFGAPDNDAGGAYGFWPFYDIECVWVNEFTSTEYWKRKITIYHMCTCPLTLWTSDGGYSQGQELQIITKHTTLTQGITFLGIKGVTIDCPDPPQ
jgi:RHS repeat-associated protein